MKRSLVLVAAMLLAASAMGQSGKENTFFSSAARYVSADLCKAQRQWLSALDSENDGVVEASIAHLTKMKLAVPDAECPKVAEKLRELSVEGRTTTIRCKANLAAMVFADAESFRMDNLDSYVEPEDLFAAVAARVQQILLASNDR